MLAFFANGVYYEVGETENKKAGDTVSLSEYCCDENFAWGNHYARAFNAQVDPDTFHTVIRYQIPFPPDEEKLFMARFGLPANKRMEFYQNLVRCIQQQIKTSQLLNAANVPSILGIYRVEQMRDDDGIMNIYLETEQVWPIRLRLLAEEVERIDAINIIARLSVTLRDVNKPPHNVVMRGLDVNEIYVNSDQRILLGGFYYASSPGLPPYPAYLPGHPNNLTEDILHGGAGDSGTDMHSLACLAWNLFSGTPLDAQIPDYLTVYPQYGTEDLALVLWLGRCGKAEDTASFRKRLSDCRKQISKDAKANVRIPVRSQRRKQYAIEIV